MILSEVEKTLEQLKSEREVALKYKKLQEQKREITEKTARNDWIENLKKYQKIKELTPEIIDSLIDTIYVHEDDKITIQFRYEDEYKKAIDFIKENQNKTNKKLLYANI